MISDFGRLKTFQRDKKGQIMKPYAQAGEYLKISLYGSDGKEKRVYVHRLVAQAFVENPHEYRVVNHLDGNKQNNRADNLEWCTLSRNSRWAYQMNPAPLMLGLIFYTQYIRPKRIEQLTVTGQSLGVYPNATIAARENGICVRNVQQAAKGQRKTAGGYRWRYYGEAAG